MVNKVTSQSLFLFARDFFTGGITYQDVKAYYYLQLHKAIMATWEKFGEGVRWAGREQQKQSEKKTVKKQEASREEFIKKGRRGRLYGNPGLTRKILLRQAEKFAICEPHRYGHEQPHLATPI